MAEKYAHVIEAFYGGAERANVTMEITFEDGRKSTLDATIAIQDVASRRAGRSRGRREEDQR